MTRLPRDDYRAPMTPLHRYVPQRRRPNLWTVLENTWWGITLASAATVVAAALIMSPLYIVAYTMRQPSRLQPVLDRTGVTGEVEVVR